jgi:hypothetical protein
MHPEIDAKVIIYIYIIYSKMEPGNYACKLEQRLHEQEAGNEKSNMVLCLNLHRCSQICQRTYLLVLHICVYI